MKRFLIPTDFSDSSQAAVGYGLELAERVGGEAFLLHVVEGHPTCRHQVGGLPAFVKSYTDPDSGISFYPVHQRVIYRDLIEEVQWRLAAMVPPRYHDRVRAIVTAGKAVDEIVRVAREQRADLIMMGNQRRGVLRRLLRRTMAERVGRKAPIPVIVVEADRHVSRGAVQGSHAHLQYTEAGDMGVDEGTPPTPRSRKRTGSRAVGV
ncbi:MAG TPA: universal stress protein [Candidatus Tectomicrobia bacterium]|nr:universal stress protein [Candidatus Tectomicrobia bacterium]